MYIVMPNSMVIQLVQRLRNHKKQTYILPDDSLVYRTNETLCSYVDILLKLVNLGDNSLTSPKEVKNLYALLEGQIYTRAMAQFSAKVETCLFNIPLSTK